MSDDNLLLNVYLFKGLTGDYLELINKCCELQNLSPGQDIFLQGEEAKALYIIKHGTVRIHQRSSAGDNIEITSLGTGSHFGEMAFVDKEKRSASASVVEATELITIAYNDLQDVLNEHIGIAAHFYKALSHFLCGRLRVTTNDLSFAKERNLTHF